MSPIPTFTKLAPEPSFNDLVAKVNTLVGEITNLMLNLDSLNVTHLTAETIDTGTLNANLVKVRGENGTKFFQLDENGIVANNGTIDTMKFDLATGLLTVVSMLIKSSNSNERVAIDSTGFHSYDSSNVERLTIGTSVAKGVKAVTYRDTSGVAQGVSVYDVENVDGGNKTGLYHTAHGAYLLFDTNGDIRIQAADGKGFRAVSGTPELNDGFGWTTIAKAGVATSSHVQGNHNHGIPDGTVLLVSGGGTVTFSASGGFTHSHTQN